MLIPVAKRHNKLVPPHTPCSVEIRYFFLSGIADSLPGAFISCVDKKRTKETTRGEALELHSFRDHGGFGTFLPGINAALSSGLLSRRLRPNRFLFVSIFCVASRRIRRSNCSINENLKCKSEIILMVFCPILG